MNKKIIRIVALVLVAVLTLSLCSCTDFGDEELKRASEIPQTKEEIFNYFSKAMDLVIEKNPAIGYKVSQKAKSPETENSDVKAAFATVASLLTGDIKDSTEYGEDCSRLFPTNALELKDIKSANIVDIDDISERSYTIELTIWEELNPTQDDSTFGKLYKITPKEDILKELKKASDYLTVENYQAQYEIGKITAVVSKEKDQLQSLKLERNIQITTEITGQNTLSGLGTVPLSFKYSATATYSADWDNPNTAEVE